MNIVRSRLERNRFKSCALNNQLQVASLFETDKDLVKIFSTYKNAQFLDIFSNGMQLYKKGLWQHAKSEFENAEKLKGAPDNPSRSLLKFMQEYNFKAPVDWNGYRKLTEK